MRVPPNRVQKRLLLFQRRAEIVSITYRIGRARNNIIFSSSNVILFLKTSVILLPLVEQDGKSSNVVPFIFDLKRISHFLLKKKKTSSHSSYPVTPFRQRNRSSRKVQNSRKLCGVNLTEYNNSISFVSFLTVRWGRDTHWRGVGSYNPSTVTTGLLTAVLW